MSLRAPGSGLRCSLSAIRADHECPLPFEFAPSSTDGPVAGSNDPANPSITAPATFVVTQTTNGVTVDAGTEAITSNRNLSVSFASETRGAVIFYTTDGSDPVPGQPATRRFDPDAPIEFAGHESGATVRTIALGPSMYPSIVTERLVSVFWDAAEAPVFTPAPGNYTTNQSVEITTPTANATIYYTIAEGTGAAPVPEPGAPGTFEYTGPIAVEGTGTAKSISAVSVRDEMVASPVSSAVYSIGFEPAQSPTFSLPAGSYASDQSVALATTEADATIYYTLSTTATAPPTPVPGAVGTFEYTGSISVAGNGSVRSITAIAVSPQKLNSLPVSATWSISYPQASAATFAPGGSIFITAALTVTLSSATSSATYTQSSYATLTRADIVALESQMSGTSIDNSDGDRIPVGQVIVYRTGDDNYGKLYVLASDGSNNDGLTFDYITYGADGSILASGPAGAGTTVIGTWGIDLDLDKAQQGEGVLDFRLVNQTSTERWLDPQGTAVFSMVP